MTMAITIDLYELTLQEKETFKLGSSLGLLLQLQAPYTSYYATNTHIADMMYLVKNAHLETVQFFEKIVHVSKILTSSLSFS